MQRSSIDVLGSPSLRSGEGAGARVEALQDELFETVVHQMRALAGAGCPDLADLVQSACEQVLRSSRSFEARCSPRTWIWQICYRTMLKQRRWYRRWLRRFVLAPDGDAPESVDPAMGVSSSIEQRERVLRLRAAIARLSPKRRAVVVLHDLEGLSVPEVAQIVNANELTVRSRLRDGRRDLAGIVRSDPYFGDDACSREEAT